MLKKELQTLATETRLPQKRTYLRQIWHELATRMSRAYLLTNLNRVPRTKYCEAKNPEQKHERMSIKP